MAIANLRTQAFHCRACKTHDTVVQVYPFRLACSIMHPLALACNAVPMLTHMHRVLCPLFMCCGARRI